MVRSYRVHLLHMKSINSSRRKTQRKSECYLFDFIYHCYCGGAQYCVFIILLFMNSTKVSVCLHLLMRLNQVTFKLISECFLQVCPTNSNSRSHHFYEISTLLFWKLNLLTLLAYFMYILKFSPHKLLLFLFEFSYPLMTAVYMICYEGAPVTDFLKMI